MNTERIENLLEGALDELKDIRLALQGNTKLGIEGIVKKVERHDNWITNMNLRMAAFGGAGAIVGTLFTFICKDLISFFTGHK